MGRAVTNWLSSAQIGASLPSRHAIRRSNWAGSVRLSALRPRSASKRGARGVESTARQDRQTRQIVPPEASTNSFRSCSVPCLSQGWPTVPQTENPSGMPEDDSLASCHPPHVATFGQLGPGCATTGSDSRSAVIRSSRRATARQSGQLAETDCGDSGAGCRTQGRSHSPGQFAGLFLGATG